MVPPRIVRTGPTERSIGSPSIRSDDGLSVDNSRRRCQRTFALSSRPVIMMALEEIPYEEIAETIGITQNNVRVRMNRIREKLRKLMQVEGWK